MARRKAGGPGMDKEAQALSLLGEKYLQQEPEKPEKEKPELTGYRHHLDKYVRGSYFLTHEQMDQIKQEADFRGEELSTFVRYIIDYYYERNPLTLERLRQLLDERYERATMVMADTEPDGDPSNSEQS